jgi:hypothetical protein
MIGIPDKCQTCGIHECPCCSEPCTMNQGRCKSCKIAFDWTEIECEDCKKGEKHDL